MKDPKASTLTLTINLRRIPPMTGDQLKAHLTGQVEAFRETKGVRIDVGGWR